MRALLTFLEGILSFLSPCMLPLLPVYLSYFAGNADRKQRTFLHALCFIAGFTLIFSLMGLFFGTMGSLFTAHTVLLNLICGAVVIVFGLSYLNIIPLPFFRGGTNKITIKNPVSAFLFGLIYSISLTPCVGAFLGSALMLASTAGSAGRGLMLLICYSLGLGIPFLVAALLIDRLAKAFDAVKRHYRIINLICGVFLIAVGVCMMCGWLNRLMGFFA